MKPSTQSACEFVLAKLFDVLALCTGTPLQEVRLQGVVSCELLDHLRCCDGDGDIAQVQR